jgi:hypothetical protein
MHDNTDVSLQPTCVQPAIDVPLMLGSPAAALSGPSFDAVQDAPNADTNLGER